MAQNASGGPPLEAAGRHCYDCAQSRYSRLHAQLSGRYLTHTVHMSVKPIGLWTKPPMRLLVTRKSR